MMKYSQEKKSGSPPFAKISFTDIATKSNPKYFKFFCSKANLSFVPTPSVLLKSIGSLYLSFFKSKIEQNPPGFKITSFLKFFFVIVSSFLTNLEDFFVSTPDAL